MPEHIANRGSDVLQSPTQMARSLKLKPADPFELIRWLARTQGDPRKAVAELVQNSIADFVRAD